MDYSQLPSEPLPFPTSSTSRRNLLHVIAGEQKLEHVQGMRCRYFCD